MGRGGLGIQLDVWMKGIEGDSGGAHGGGGGRHSGSSQHLFNAPWTPGSMLSLLCESPLLFLPTNLGGY